MAGFPNLRTLCLLLFIALCAATCGTRPANADPVYRDPSAPLEKRVSDLFSRLTQDEKISLLTGTQFSTNPIPRLGIPAMEMADAGQGVRGGMPGTTGPATLFPAGVTMASTWDPDLVGQIGKAIGEEALNKGPGIQMMLGPAINIHRAPLNGRNGEYFSEDPFLAGRLAVGYVKGMQSTGCAACAKHFACNNEEVDRGFVDVLVGERALREIYLPAFEATAREGHVWTIMTSYNKVNGFHNSANKYLTNSILKGDWDWDGMVTSDWGGVHETVGPIVAGNDIEMPGPGYLRADRVLEALANHKITQQEIDANVRRIVRVIIRTGCADPVRHVPDSSVVNSREHQHLTYVAASKGIVLLKNQNNALPLDATKIKSIAVIGWAATHMQYGAAGSPGLTPFYSIGPLEGITTRAGGSIRIDSIDGRLASNTIPGSAFSTPDGTPGLKAEFFTNIQCAGAPAATRIDPQIDFDWTGSPAPGIGHENFSTRWTGKLTAPATGWYMIAMTSDDGCRVFIDGKRIVSHWYNGAAAQYSGQVYMEKGHAYKLRVEYFQGIGDAVAHLAWAVPGVKRFDEAAAAAAKDDVAIVVVNTMSTEGEGEDRPTMDLPGGQADLISEIAAVNKHTIVVLNNGAPVTLTPWLGSVPAVVETFFPGQEGGHALAAVLFGDVNPSGKLPDTFAARREDYPDYGNFPGTIGTVKYEEGIYVGYRHFDQAGIEPIFPFGYGLSYTTFKYSNLRLSSPTLDPKGTVNALVDVTNTGGRTGAEVVELYVHDPSPKIDKPVRELKGFGKVELEPGQTKTVSMPLDGRSFAYCDVEGHRWKADKGEYEIEVGASSRDIRLKAPLTLLADYTDALPHMGEAPPPPPPPPARGEDIAKEHKALSSSDQDTEYPASAAFDGDETTRWSAGSGDPQWIQVDLDKPTTIGGVGLFWETAFASSYKIQVSLDGAAWTDVYSTTTGTGGQVVVHFKPVTARYVRMLGEKRGTQYSYSIWSFEVYAK